MDKTTIIILSVFGSILLCLFVVPFMLWVVEVMWNIKHRRITKRWKCNLR